MGSIGDKPIIGILGGIGSGKSTVAAEFAKLGCKVIDADRIAHELFTKKTIKEKIVVAFGRTILDSKGEIDRNRLGRIVFTDADKLSVLNGIIHPLVMEHAEELIEQYKRQNQVKAIVLDMPLLVEVGWAKRCDRLVFIDCEREIREKRAKNLGFDKNQFKIRENFQISLDNKARLTDNIIDNNSGVFTLAKQVADIFSYTVDNG